MKKICLYFQVHQPFRLKRYRFFNIGKDHQYLDDLSNSSIMKQVAQLCYIPMNTLILDLIKKYPGKFNVTFSISGTAVEQMKLYAPKALESFKKLAETGQVEFLAETYSHSLASLVNAEEFEKQVTLHKKMIETEFGQTPKAFRNTELIYSDEIGDAVANMGYETILTEGAKHILGWKSPNYIYASAISQSLKVMLRNFKMSDDIAFRFSNPSWSEWPLTADKFCSWIQREQGDVLNLFMDYETFGEHQSSETGIFKFFKHFVSDIINQSISDFVTVSEAAKDMQPIAIFNSPYPISWADEERDITAWLGNELQDEAFSKLYRMKDKINALNDANMNHVWEFMQCSDHFYYMATKWFSDGDVHKYFNPYQSPYDAFINYMNVLSDFEREVDLRYKEIVCNVNDGMPEVAVVS